MNRLSNKTRNVLTALISFLMTLCIAVSCAESINIANLYEATDEELAAAYDLIVAEQKSRIKVALAFAEREACVGLGKSMELSVETTGLPDDAEEIASEWESSRPNIATVKDGTVNGIAAGKTVISCKKTYSNDIVLEAACIVTVDIPIRKIDLPKSVMVGVGRTITLEAGVSPDNATNQELNYVSSNPGIASVNEKGEITGMGMGSCTVTAWAKDSGKAAATTTVVVPALSADKGEYVITEKDGLTIDIQCIGSSADKIDVKNLTVALYEVVKSEYNRGESTLTLDIKPIKAGKGKLKVVDGNSKEEIELTILVDNSAVYDTVSYPALKYKTVAEDPEAHMDEACSFTGEIISKRALGDGVYLYKIYTAPGEREWYENEVEVLVTPSTVIPIRILEKDIVTVYGKIINEDMLIHGTSHSEAKGTAYSAFSSIITKQITSQTSSTSTGQTISDLADMNFDGILVVSAEKIEIK